MRTKILRSPIFEDEVFKLCLAKHSGLPYRLLQVYRIPQASNVNLCPFYEVCRGRKISFSFLIAFSLFYLRFRILIFPGSIMVRFLDRSVSLSWLRARRIWRLISRTGNSFGKWTSRIPWWRPRGNFIRLPKPISPVRRIAFWDCAKRKILSSSAPRRPWSRMSIISWPASASKVPVDRAISSSITNLANLGDDSDFFTGNGFSRVIQGG